MSKREVIAVIGAALGCIGLAALIFGGCTLLIFGGCTLLMYDGNPFEPGRIKDNPSQALPDDDKLSDKHPEYHEHLTEAVKILERGRFQMNKSQAVIGLDVTDLLPEEKDTAGKLYPDFAAAIAAIPPDIDKYTKKQRQAYLPSVDMIDAFTKYTDDRLLCAIETELSTGSAIFAGGKQGFLRELAVEIMTTPQSPDRDEAIAYLLAAWELGGGKDQTLTQPFRRQIDTEVKRFDRNPMLAKPIGIYTTSDELGRVFRRDRLLQQPFGSNVFKQPGSGATYPVRPLEQAVVISEALDRRPDLHLAYITYLTLAAGITNPNANLSHVDLLAHTQHFGNQAALANALTGSAQMQLVLNRGNPGGDMLGVAFWPFATSKEDKLFTRIYQGGRLPQGKTMDDLTAAIQSGDVDLTPQADSGWYDYQLYALETLLLPGKAQEADKLLLTGRYKQRLKKAFEAMMTLRRELHIKEFPMNKSAARPTVPPTPQLTVEPAATNYLRTAYAYSELRKVITTGFGDSGFPLMDSGESLIDAIDEAINTHIRLYITCCDDIGMEQDVEWQRFRGIGVLQRRLSQSWIDQFQCHPAMQADPRVIVPVRSDASGARVRYWAVMGVTFKRVTASYATPPELEDGKQINWEPISRLIPVYSFAEIEMGPNPPTREEFQELCDRCNSQDDVIAALGAQGVWNSNPGNVGLFLGSIAFILFAAWLIIGRRKRKAAPAKE